MGEAVWWLRSRGVSFEGTWFWGRSWVERGVKMEFGSHGSGFWTSGKKGLRNET